LVGECFVIHGKLMQTNGTPDLRIWRIGTKRILGVENARGQADAEGALPDGIPYFDKLANNAVYGDFRVCPLARQRPGWMQMVCIAGWSKVVRAPY